MTDKLPLSTIHEMLMRAERDYVGKIFRHYKGELYSVTNCSIDCDDQEIILHYHPLRVNEYFLAVRFSRRLSLWEDTLEDGTPKYQEVKETKVYLTKQEQESLWEKQL